MTSLNLQCAGLYMAVLFMTLAHGAYATIQGEALAHEHTEKTFFIPNLGQWDNPSLFHFRSGPLHVYVEPQGFTYVLTDYSPVNELHAKGIESHNIDDLALNHHAFRMRFAGASDPYISGRGKQRAYRNYFIGNDQSKWKSEVPLYQGVHLQDLYPGIHLEAKSKQGALKYDIIVSPGADPYLVRMNYSGLEGISIKDGKLLLQTSLGTLEEHIPLAWQEINGSTVMVPCKYKIEGSMVSFIFPKGYDAEIPLIIDPVLVAATLSGSAEGNNFGHGATYDLEGNIFTQAISFQETDYPVSLGAFQTTKTATAAVLTKFNPDATELIWATYLGGNFNSLPHSIVTNNEGELYVYGTTEATNFPTSATAVQPIAGGAADIFVTHLNANGTALLGSTYIGGSGVDGRNNTSDFGHDALRGEIIVDDSGNAFIATTTRSTNFPTTEGAFQNGLQGNADGVVFKLSADMSVMHFSTLLGGNALDNCSGLRIKSNNNVLVSGMTNSSDFPMPAGGFQNTKNAGYDAFIIELNENGSAAVRGTFAGTQADDYAFFIDQSNTGVSIYGISLGDWPVSEGTYNSGGRTFVARFDENLTEVTHSARIGGANGALVAFMVDSCGRSYMSMYDIGSESLEITDNALFTSGGFYIAVLDQSMEALDFATYGQGSHVDGGTSRFAPNGIIYQGVCSFIGSMQGTPGSWSPGQTIEWDIGVFKIDLSLSNIEANATATDTVGCVPHTVDFENFSSGSTYIWDFGDGSPPSLEESPTHVYEQPGTYQVTLIAMSNSSCISSDTLELTLSVVEALVPDVVVHANQSGSCDALNFAAEASSTESTVNLLWILAGDTIGTGNSINGNVVQPGSYPLTVIALEEVCKLTADSTFIIEMTGSTQSVIQPEYSLCYTDESIEISALSPIEGATYFWIALGEDSPNIEVTAPGTYEVIITTDNCVDSLQAVVNEGSFIPTGYSFEACDGFPVEISIDFPFVQDPLWSDGNRDAKRVVSSAGDYEYSFTDPLGCRQDGLVSFIALPENPRIEIPNVFTPNGDGVNDTFLLDGGPLQYYNLSIRNRWGTELFKTETIYEAWNGRSMGDGDFVNEGSYFYILHYQGECQRSIQSAAGYVQIKK